MKRHPALNRPLPTAPSPELVDGELVPLLDEPFASVWAGPAPAAPRATRQRLMSRLAATREAEAGMVTARRRRVPRQALADGVGQQLLYQSSAGAAARPGEPLRARLIELSAGTAWASAAEPELRERHCEWLVLAGQVEVDGARLSLRDYHVSPAGHAPPRLFSRSGALLFLRESALDAAFAPTEAFTVLDADAGWPAYAPGVQRRVLWQGGGQAALLYWAQPGAQVPSHRHGHDEECLMLQGELYLDDLLLQSGDYQLAPAGSGHRVTQTETGVVIYAHGDCDLKFVD